MDRLPDSTQVQLSSLPGWTGLFQAFMKVYFPNVVSWTEKRSFIGLRLSAGRIRHERAGHPRVLIGTTKYSLMDVTASTSNP